MKMLKYALLALAIVAVSTGAQLELGPYCGITWPMIAVSADTLDLGRYCSMTWPTGGWALVLYPNLTQDPCADIKKKSDPGGTVQRAGLYSAKGFNNVVVRCDTNASWIWLGTGAADGPFAYTYKKASDGKHKGCIFTAAPRELPIFNTPYPASTNVTHVTGVDFARDTYVTLDLAHEFGQPGASTQASVVDWKARDKTGQGFRDDHDGHDINMAIGTEIRTVAGGTVLAARFRDVSNIPQAKCPGTIKTQGEIWIEHTVSGGSGGQYDEHFVTFYAHLSKIEVKAGDQVQQGQKIGLSGNTGCTTQAHLHFGTFKISNTAGYLTFPMQINTDFSAGKDQNSSNLWRVMIDPYGFYPPAGFDPWAWKAYPNPNDPQAHGALSVNLWALNQAPPTGNW